MRYLFPVKNLIVCSTFRYNVKRYCGKHKEKNFSQRNRRKIRMLTAFWSGFSPSIFPAWLYLPEDHMPLPAEFSGSLKRTSPSTTARWQSIGGDVRGGGGVVIFSLGVLRQY